MHHRAAGHGDVDGPPRPTVDPDHRVLDLVAAVRAVRNRVQLTGFWVALRVRCVPAGQRPVEVAHPDGVQFIGELIVDAAAFDQGEGLAGVSDHVGVGAERIQAVMAIRWGLAEFLRHVRAPHPAVAVPVRLAVADADAVHHAVTDEPVAKVRIDLADRIGPISQVAPVQVVRDRPCNLEVSQRVFLLQRGERTLQIAVGHDGPPTPLDGLLVQPQQSSLPLVGCASVNV